MGETTFEELVGRVRSGDPDAATDLVRRYEPAIRRVVRLRLGGGGRLDGLFDSMDVCQSVLGSFFLRVAAGQYTLDSPAELLKLLTAMTRNKLAFQVRKQRAQKRDCNRDAQVGMDGRLAFPGGNPEPTHRSPGTPRRTVQAADDRGATAGRVADPGARLERDRRPAAGSAEALRKKHARALDRVAKELGLEAV